MDIAKDIAEIRNETIALRRDFHQHPELGMQEFRTGGKIVAYLEGCGLEISRFNVTGVCGLLRGAQPGPTLLLRADMDALPIQEETEVPFKSVEDGVMHACGHDAHTAILLATAKILSKWRAELKGNIKFVFEPNEENVGALAMINEGVMENPRVDACMGLHVWNPLPIGKVGISSGPVMAGMAHFELVIKGQGGHTATPQHAVDPILAAAAVIQGVQVLQTRELDVLKEPTILMFGKINGGSASNVIPDAVTLGGTLRYMFAGPEESNDHPKKRFERVVANICAAHRAQYELHFEYAHPTLVNHAEMTQLLSHVATSELKPAPEVVSLVTLAGEDFSEFAARAPAAFLFIGAGRPGQSCFPHHHCCFDIDEDALQLGVELLTRGALRFFKNASDLRFLQQNQGRKEE